VINQYRSGNILPADSAILIDTYLHKIFLYLFLHESSVQILKAILSLGVISLNVPNLHSEEEYELYFVAFYSVSHIWVAILNLNDWVYS